MWQQVQKRLRMTDRDDENNTQGAKHPVNLPKPPAWMRGVSDPAQSWRPEPVPPTEPPRPPAWMQPIPDPEQEQQKPLPARTGAVSAGDTRSTLPPLPPLSPPITAPDAPTAPPPGPTAPGMPEIPAAEDETDADEEFEGLDFLDQEGEFATAADEMPGEDADDEAALIIDPAFAYIIALIVTVFGLSNFTPDVRYALLWAGLTVVGAAAITADNLYVERPTLRDLAVGVGYGVIIALPLLIIGAPTLRRLSYDIFGRVGDASVFMALAFAMPMAETLFFRGAFQSARGLVSSVLAASGLSLILFIPAMNLADFPLVAVVIGLAFLMINFVYGYLARRIGLFTAWAAQIAANLLLLWVSRLIG